MRPDNKILIMCILIFQLILLPALCLTGQPSILVVIDPLVENEINDITGIYPGQKVITLPEEGNPISFISKELKRTLYDEIHLYLLTKPGSIIFDEINLIPESIRNYSGDFNEWKIITKPELKIIIHSENLTSGPEGEFLIQKIAEYTGKIVVVRK